MEYNIRDQNKGYNPDYGTVVWAENTSGYPLFEESFQYEGSSEISDKESRKGLEELT